ncbi:MAG: hypothetical protein PUE32_03180 [Clostridia bacterium]|nr:hypothetical protein [Clostridia bacterium]
MKIANSSVVMASGHQESSYSYKKSVTMEASISKDLPGAILTLSAEAEGKSFIESMEEYKEQKKEEAARKKQENEQRFADSMAEQLRKLQKSGSLNMEMSDEYRMKLELLKRLFQMLTRGRALDDSGNLTQDSPEILDLRSPSYRIGTESSSTSVSVKSLGSISIGTGGSGTTWQRVTATSGFVSESESTTFASSGMVKTQDGRSIDFNIEVSMSRAFTSQINTLTTQNYIKTDPLVINLDTDIGSVTDQKFLFDLDSDGEEEEISFAGKGSGFLALDRNGDGRIGDGSELFGTKSGDGFKDLAAFDEDGNGWIDENDSIYSKLKVWTKDEDGNDYLINLKDADVGAIYLDNADTQFSLKDGNNRLNGEIKKTGIYLHESTGAAGTLNHVDLAV